MLDNLLLLLNTYDGGIYLTMKEIHCIYESFKEETSRLSIDIAQKMSNIPSIEYITMASWIYYQNSHIDEALELIYRAISINNNNSLLYFILGRIVNETHIKLEAYSKSIDLCSERSLAYNNRGNIYKTDLMDYEKALKDYTKSIELDSSYGYALINRGHLYKNSLKRPDLALEDYTRTIELTSGKDAAVAYFSRANLYKHNYNDKENALKDYNKSIELDPSDSDVFNNRGNLFRDYFNDFDSAIADYTKSIELNPKNGNAYFNRGHLYFNRLKQYDLAKEDYLVSLNLMPNDPDIYFHLGWMYDTAFQDSSKALEFYSLAIKNGDGESLADYYHNRAVLYHNILNNPEAAINDYTNALSYIKDDPMIYCNRGVCYEDKLGEFVLAFQDYTKALELSPDFQQAYTFIQVLLTKINSQNHILNM